MRKSRGGLINKIIEGIYLQPRLVRITLGAMLFGLLGLLTNTFTIAPGSYLLWLFWGLFFLFWVRLFWKDLPEETPQDDEEE